MDVCMNGWDVVNGCRDCLTRSGAKARVNRRWWQRGKSVAA